MTRIKRLQPVIEHNDKKEKLALLEVAKSQSLLQMEQARLDQLEGYKLEYLEQKKQDVGLSTPIQLQEFNRFLQQLEQTITQQQEVVALREQELEQNRCSWQATRIDSRVMHKVVEKIEQQESIEQERKEQKVQDEFALRKNPRR